MALVRGGSCVVSQDGRQARLRAGEFALYDTRRPYEVGRGPGMDRPVQMMTFMFPPALLPMSRNQLRQLAAVPFPAGAGLGDVTSQFLLQLARNSTTAARARRRACRPPRWRCLRHGWRVNWTPVTGTHPRLADMPC